ncbi:MAG TPA: S26 family signal peptidase [Cellvibrionaceae bacterium]|nr:S26 family signal peptidase [Cellvibrionaceae bacterium]
MGDNRRDSIDSRRFGGISSTDIQGKVMLIVFSLEADLHLRAGRWLKYPAGLGEG